MGQVIEGMARQRGAVTVAEVDAATLKEQVKALQAEIEKAKQEAAKPKEPEKAKEPTTTK